MILCTKIPEDGPFPSISVHPSPLRTDFRGPDPEQKSYIIWTNSLSPWLKYEGLQQSPCVPINATPKLNLPLE